VRETDLNELSLFVLLVFVFVVWVVLRNVIQVSSLLSQRRQI
jgi:hypothetical protein